MRQSDIDSLKEGDIVKVFTDWNNGYECRIVQHVEDNEQGRRLFFVNRDNPVNAGDLLDDKYMYVRTRHQKRSVQKGLILREVKRRHGVSQAQGRKVLIKDAIIQVDRRIVNLYGTVTSTYISEECNTDNWWSDLIDGDTNKSYQVLLDVKDYCMFGHRSMDTGKGRIISVLFNNHTTIQYKPDGMETVDFLKDEIRQMNEKFENDLKSI